MSDAWFEIPTQSITALVGPNGAGKSTLMRAAIGFERADAGRLLVLGRDPKHDRAACVNAIGYVPQGSSLYRSLSIADHFAMAEAARASFDRSYAVRRVIEAGLSEDRVVDELSGGERAQVALALALGTKAPLLVMDEPLANLDPLARRAFLTAVVDDARARGATAILSSHIVTDIEQACDRVMILGLGKVVLNESIADAKRQHCTVPGSQAGQSVIGSFGGPTGDWLTLVRDERAGRAASLEEIVLGYLAAGAR